LAKAIGRAHLHKVAKADRKYQWLRTPSGELTKYLNRAYSLVLEGDGPKQDKMLIRCEITATYPEALTH